MSKKEIIVDALKNYRAMKISDLKGAPGELFPDLIRNEIDEITEMLKEYGYQDPTTENQLKLISIPSEDLESLMDEMQRVILEAEKLHAEQDECMDYGSECVMTLNFKSHEQMENFEKMFKGLKTIRFERSEKGGEA